MTVGAVGPPGQRVFYLQAREGVQVVSLKLEKEQILFLAGGLTEVLADLASPTAVPPETDLALEEPVEPEWAVRSLQLAYDADTDRVVLVARESGDGETQAEAGTVDVEGPDEGTAPRPDPVDEEGEENGVARFLLTREQAAGVIAHGKRLLRGGRPPCPLCGFPLGEDHSCPKTNGHRAPTL